jgi:hypothetical protein
LTRRSQRAYALEAAEAAINVYSLSIFFDSGSDDLDDLEAVFRNLEKIKGHRYYQKRHLRFCLPSTMQPS